LVSSSALLAAGAATDCAVQPVAPADQHLAFLADELDHVP
jgi:hypothetical protein